MTSASRLILAALTGISILFLLIALVIIWTGWFLPEPHYTANSYNEVILKEIFLSLRNLVINVLILFLPLYVISLSLKNTQNLVLIKRISIILGISLLLSTLFIFKSIVESLNLWQPLVQATDGIDQRSFSRGRGGGLGLQKSYLINFTAQGSDLSIVKNDILPYLTSAGYSVSDFGISIRRQQYTNISELAATDIRLENVDEVPFETPLQKLDYANINFVKRNPYDSINLLINNYQENNVLEGTLKSYH